MIAGILFTLSIFIIGFSLGGSVAYGRWVKTCYSPSTVNVKWKGKEYRALEQQVPGLVVKFDSDANVYVATDTFWNMTSQGRTVDEAFVSLEDAIISQNKVKAEMEQFAKSAERYAREK